MNIYGIKFLDPLLTAAAKALRCTAPSLLQFPLIVL